MDIAAILALVAKGMDVITTAVAIGKEVAPAVQVVKDLVTGAQTGDVTDAQLEATEATLDQMISDFNAPLD